MLFDLNGSKHVLMSSIRQAKMEMETEDDVDGNPDPPSSAVGLAESQEFQPEIAEVAPAGNQELVAS
jgi:hypothetical protein